MLLLSAVAIGGPFYQREDICAARRKRAAVAEAHPALVETSGMELAHFLQQQLRISQLEDELSRVNEYRRFASPTRTLQNHKAILEMTAEVFPNANVSVLEESDPEIENDEHFAVSVRTPGTVDEVVALHGEWHRRLRQVAPETASFYCLLLDIDD
ncbi:MAG TPA: hypothetical protein VGI40_10375 [Pirellulaceae bacterium]|jgi:hypothetical protein